MSTTRHLTFVFVLLSYCSFAAAADKSNSGSPTHEAEIIEEPLTDTTTNSGFDSYCEKRPVPSTPKSLDISEEINVLSGSSTRAVDHFSIEKITVRTNNIFVEDEQSIWLHELANRFHSLTKSSVIENLLPFSRGDQVSVKELAEAERILRQQRYIRDAKITVINQPCSTTANKLIRVETWDKWTMFPTFNIGRSGGGNKVSMGFKDDNLLGLGIKGRIKYFDDGYRSGYGFRVGVPLTLLGHSTFALSAFDNDDGNHYGATFNKPFYTVKDDYSFLASFNLNTKNTTLSHNGEDANTFAQDKREFDLSLGKSLATVRNTIRRLKFGLSFDNRTFSSVSTESEFTTELPSDREFFYPWIEFQSQEDSHAILSNVYSISQREDHRLGWSHKFRLGLEGKNNEGKGRGGLHIFSQSRKKTLGKNSFHTFEIETVGNFSVADKSFYKLSLGAEYLYGLDSDLKFYARAHYVLSANNYLDSPLTLGGDSDDEKEFEMEKDESRKESVGPALIRGYPSQYQYGNKLWQTSFEIRHYPHIELYRMFEIAWAGFIDAGRAWGEPGPLGDNIDSSTLTSIGLSLRLISTRSSGKKIIHIDVSRPLGNHAESNGWEIRAESRRKF